MTERYTLEEQETIISWDRAGDTASIYTFDPRWQKHIENVLGVQPSKKTKRGYAREYEIPKKWLMLPRKPRRASPKQREAATRALAKARASRAVAPENALKGKKLSGLTTKQGAKALGNLSIPVGLSREHS